MIRDLWTFIKLIPKGWKTHRMWAKAERELLKKEKEYGIYKTFLMYFEEALLNQVDDEFLIVMLESFQEDYPIDVTDGDCMTILQYISKYEVNPYMGATK